MLELLVAFLELLLEIVFEAPFEFAADFLGALILRGIAEIFDTSEFKNPLLASNGHVFLSRVAGGLSPLFFPHPLDIPKSARIGLMTTLSPGTLEGCILHLFMT
jgi:hypothetical protein